MQSIFVFGSNLAGRHGKGAALHARLHCDAETGVGEGLTGTSYALPTKDENLKKRSLGGVRQSYLKFLSFAENTPQFIFELTPFGTGLAGFDFDTIKTLVLESNVPRNVLFTQEWIR